MEVIDTGGGFRLTGSRGSGVMSWQVCGDLDVFGSMRLREVVEGWILAGYLYHTVDLTATTSLDASGIRDLVSLHKLLRDRGELRVQAALTCQPGRLLASTGATRILHVSYQAAG